MKEFLHSCAYLGYSNFDLSKLTQVFRRIYKKPDKIEDINMILDYLITLALSDAYYKDFEEKDVAFVTQCIDIIEKKFTGI